MAVVNNFCMSPFSVVFDTNIIMVKSLIQTYYENSRFLDLEIELEIILCR